MVLVIVLKHSEPWERWRVRETTVVKTKTQIGCNINAMAFIRVRSLLAQASEVMRRVLFVCTVSLTSAMCFWFVRAFLIHLNFQFHFTSLAHELVVGFFLAFARASKHIKISDEICQTRERFSFILRALRSVAAVKLSMAKERREKNESLIC